MYQQPWVLKQLLIQSQKKKWLIIPAHFGEYRLTVKLKQDRLFWLQVDASTFSTLFLSLDC